MRLVFAALFSSILVWAQPQYTVWQTVATGATGPVRTMVRNIGQTSHLMTIVFRDAPGMTCTHPGLLEYQQPLTSFIGMHSAADLVGFQLLTRAINVSTSGVATDRFRTIAVADGAFPIIYASVSFFDIVNCVADVSYSGSLTPLVLPPLDYNSPLTSYSATAVAGSTVLVAARPGFRIAVYALLLHNLTAQNVNLMERRTDALNLVMLAGEAMPANGIYSKTAPSHEVPLFLTLVGSDIHLDLSVPTHTNFYILYRYE